MLLCRLLVLALLLSTALCGSQRLWRQFCSQAAQMHEYCVGDVEEAEPDDETIEGPKRYYFSSTMTWNSGKSFCQAHRKRMCYSRELCQANGVGSEFMHDVIPGDNWVPVLDDENEWLEAGSSSGRTCFIHSAHYGKPAWGTSTTSAPHKGYVFCCEDDPSTGIINSEMRFQYLGNAATYTSLQLHCEAQNMSLCSASEVCQDNVPYFGVVAGDHWAPVNDRFNEWVEIGNDLGRTCWVHGPHYSAPAWGVRTDGSASKYIGYVICCPSSDRPR